MKPRPLGGEPVQVSRDEDRREKLAKWLVSASNPFFAKAAVNRIWYHLMGRGIGYIDVHLLASVALDGTATLWTRDKRLAALAVHLALADGERP